MAKDNKAESVVSAKAISQRCPRHGVRMVHMEYMGLMGWKCPVEGCPAFNPDPTVAAAKSES